MNVADLIHLVARRWLVIVIFTLLGGAVAFLAVYKVGPGGISARNVGYSSSATILIDQPGVQGAGAGAALGRLILLPNSYKLVVESSEIADLASEKVGGAYEAQEIAECTTVQTVTGTQIMEVSSCGDNPTDAQQVTSAVVASFQDWLQQRQDQANVLGPNRIVATVITAPQEPSGPSGFPPSMWVALGVVVGLLFGVMTAVGIESVKAETPVPVSAVPQIGEGNQGAPAASGGGVTLPAVQSQNPSLRRPY